MSPPSPLILLAEDNPPTAEITKEIIETLGYRVEVAPNGRIAVARTAELLPTLVLMDVQMPEMDGLEATRAIKADPRTAHVPVVCLTAFAMAEEERRCLDAGAELHLAKPIDFERLAKVLDRYCKPIG
jgi:two-component system sensor histidine kinase/response regulator